jgi:hypothetical protein
LAALLGGQLADLVVGLYRQCSRAPTREIGCSRNRS